MHLIHGKAAENWPRCKPFSNHRHCLLLDREGELTIAYIYNAAGVGGPYFHIHIKHFVPNKLFWKFFPILSAILPYCFFLLPTCHIFISKLRLKDTLWFFIVDSPMKRLSKVNALLYLSCNGNWRPI